MKVLLFHPMQQHSYKTAEALQKKGWLFKYWTSVYYQPKKLIYRLLKLILGKNNLTRMINKENILVNSYVKTTSELLGLMYLFLCRVDKKGSMTYYLQYVLSKVMGKQVARYAIKNRVDYIIAYDTWAFGVIKELKRRKSEIPVILDYSSLYAEKIMEIIQNDIKNSNIGTKPYERLFLKYDKKYLKEYKYEKDNADYFLSASSVVDNSLCDYGVESRRIYRCTYGSYFQQLPVVRKDYSKVKFIYIGRMSYAKGIHHLLDAFNRIESAEYELILVGEDVDGLVQKNTNSNIKYAGLVRHDEIPKYLENADVVVSASLYDGFSLSILEAAAYNLPIVCTNSTGVCDWVKNGENGYVVDTQDSEQLKKIIEYLLNNKHLIGEMSEKVGQILRRISWESYYSDVQSALTKIHTQERKKKD